MKNRQKFFSGSWYNIKEQLFNSYTEKKNIQKILEVRESMRVNKNYETVLKLIRNGKKII